MQVGTHSLKVFCAALFLMSNTTHADILLGLGVGNGVSDANAVEKGEGKPTVNRDAGDTGFGAHWRLGYQGESFRTYLNSEDQVGILGTIFTGDFTSVSSYAIAHDFLFKTDNGIFQAFVGPHASYITMQSCYSEGGIFSFPSDADKDAEHCEKDSGLGAGAQLGLIFQPVDLVNLELGYSHTWAFDVKTKETDAKGAEHTNELESFGYAYLGVNVTF